MSEYAINAILGFLFLGLLFLGFWKLIEIIRWFYRVVRAGNTILLIKTILHYLPIIGRRIEMPEENTKKKRRWQK